MRKTKEMMIGTDKRNQRDLWHGESLDELVEERIARETVITGTLEMEGYDIGIMRMVMGMPSEPEVVPDDTPHP